MQAALTTLAVLATAAAAWLGLAWLVLSVPPSEPLVVPAFYVFAFAAVASTLSVAAWALRPVRDGRLRSPAPFVGHAMLLSAIGLFGLWLQSLRMLTPTVALLLGGLYIFLELALLYGTRGAVEVEIHRP